MEKVYLDNAATTRPWKQVVKTVVQAMEDGFGNASSLHARGLAAQRAIADAERVVREVVGSGPWDVVFTSGGSESDTMAVVGSVPRGKRDLAVTTTVEHAAVDDACKRIEERGARSLKVSAGSRGVVDPEELADMVDDSAALVSVTGLANEIGTVQPVTEIARLVKRKAARCHVHVDAVQALAQLPTLDYPPEVDMVSISAHKIHGPQGVGALLVRPGVRPRPIICGAAHQGGLRPGTLNVPGIAGFAEAIAIHGRCRRDGAARMAELTDRLVADTTGSVAGVRLLGDRNSRPPGIAVLAVDRAPSEVLLHALEMRGVLASSGSACHSRRSEASQCLRDAGLKPSEGVVRFSLTVDTAAEEIQLAIEAFVDAVQAVRSGRASRE